MKYLREQISSNNLKTRLLYSFIIFLLLFIGTTILSYYILPQGFLKGKLPSGNIETSSSVLISTIQIFIYNFISVVFIFIASLFNQKKEKDENYYSIGYSVFFILITINAITLGTWSFGINTEAPNLINRIIEIFNVVNRAGLWEMLGQLFITCAIAHIGLVLTNGKKTITLKIGDIKLTKYEIVFIILGLSFMVIGALIESIAIININ